MPTFTLPGNKNIVFRFFERVETDHTDRLVQETGMVIGGRLHTIICGGGSPAVAALTSARSNYVSRPIIDGPQEKSKDTPTDTQSEDKSEDPSTSEETEGDTPSVETEVVPSTEETSVDTPAKPEASHEVETQQDVIDRKYEEAMDDEGDYTGHTYS